MLSDQLATEGYAVIPRAVDGDTIAAVTLALTRIGAAAQARGGVRNLLRTVPVVRELARSGPIRAVATAALGPGAFCVRAILFDKTADANWKVIWHQDLTIAVVGKSQVPDFGPWSEKDGVDHVQPPTEMLTRLVAVRVHLDDCMATNGPVRVLAGSHRDGRLTGAAIDAWRARAPEVVCTVPRGGILAFHSLLLHASSPALQPAHRRVVHLEFAADELPGELAWYDRVA